MSLDNIQLPAIVVAALYKKTLIHLDPQKELTKTAPEKVATPLTVLPKNNAGEAPMMKYLGANKKGIVLLVDEKDAIYLTEGQMEFLIKVIAACQLTMDDCAIVNLANQQVDYQALEKQLQAKSVLMMGVLPNQINLPLAFPAYQVQAYRTARYVCSEPINTLMANVEEKRKFWTTLKTIFNLA